MGSRLDAPATSASTDGASWRGAVRVVTSPVSRSQPRCSLHSWRIDPDLRLALELADAADVLTMARFRALDLVVETKPDLTPVTESDRSVEQTLRDRIGRARAGDAIVGEEYGATGDGDRRWIIDPIDGTRSYARGIPVWATLVALEREGELAVGVVSAPALRARWWAARGGGAFRDGESVRVSNVSRIEDAHLAYDALGHFEAVGRGEQFLALARRCWRTRGFGDFWPYVLVADGSIDIAVEPEGLSLWDLAAPLVIVEAAGGRFTDFEGIARADGGNAVATNGILHDEVLAALVP